MKYIIYKLIQPSHLKEIVYENYFTKTIDRNVLEKLDIRGVKEEHPTMESAIAEIHNKKDLLKNLELTIIPVFSILWDGEVV